MSKINALCNTAGLFAATWRSYPPIALGNLMIWHPFCFVCDHFWGTTTFEADRPPVLKNQYVLKTSNCANGIDDKYCKLDRIAHTQTRLICNRSPYGLTPWSLQTRPVTHLNSWGDYIYPVFVGTKNSEYATTRPHRRTRPHTRPHARPPAYRRATSEEKGNGREQA